MGRVNGPGSAPFEVAYFSMEIAVDDRFPTYSGGLGVLAGDHLRAAADAGMPLVAVTLVYRQGYFEQHVDGEGRQTEEPVRWSPGDALERIPLQVEVEVAGRPVRVGAWRTVLTGVTGACLPVYFLDTDLEANAPIDRSLTDQLYGGDDAMRLGQEIVLGMAGPALLDALGHQVGTYHMNEGHSALLTLALLGSGPGREPGARWDAVRSRCVFTTHTPVPAGHDRFERSLVERLLGSEWCRRLDELGLLEEDELNMTELALSGSRWANAVSLRHRDVTQAMFPGRRIDAVTNGVHAATWVAEPMQRLFDRHVPRWRQDNTALRTASAIPLDEVRAAHGESKRAMTEAVALRTGVRIDPDVLTLGVARRATAYKRTDLVLSDPERLRDLAGRVGPLQLVFAGKAHPRDDEGKELIRRVVAAAHLLVGAVTVVFVEGYSMALARLLCAGTDVWCNTPVRPQEASGTSGMKAALNGVPSLSVLDGWWLEGCWEGVTGWSIGPAPQGAADVGGDPALDDADADALYDRLEREVVPAFYGEPDRFAEVMRNAIALNGSFFTTERMVRQYALAAYRIGEGPAGRAPDGDPVAGRS